MRNRTDNSEQLVDLWQAEVLPVEETEAASDNAIGCEQATQEGFTVQLTGWRGAGWRMVFLDEPKADE